AQGRGRGDTRRERVRSSGCGRISGRGGGRRCWFGRRGRRRRNGGPDGQPGGAAARPDGAVHRATAARNGPRAATDSATSHAGRAATCSTGVAGGRVVRRQGA